MGRDGELEGKLSHILWHIRDSRGDPSGILLSDSSELFMTCFKAHLRRVFEEYIALFGDAVTRDFLLNHLIGSFAEAVLWWMREDMAASPEAVAGYFVKMTGKR